MRGTLSHRSSRPAGALRVGPAARGRLGLVLLIGLSLGACRQGEPVAEGNADASASEDRPVEATEFAWPEDPSHPVLELRIATPARRGAILIELMPELAPTTVVNVIDLADAGYYDGTTFHRVIPGFMIQGGDPNSRDRDPTNDGTGGSERPLHDEFGAAPFVRGVVGMGNRGRPDSTSAQFFIMHADQRNLDGRYTPVGRVLHGMDLVDAITEVSIDRAGRWGPKDRPIENVVIERARTIGQVAAVEASRGEERDRGPTPPTHDILAAAPAPRSAEGVTEPGPAPPPAAPNPSATP